MSEKINKNKVVFSPINLDSVGAVFFYEGRVFRGIKTEAVQAVKEIFSSGLIEELVKSDLFPASWISDYELEGYGMVVEHERITPVIYACEWSFGMLKDAALTILKVNIISRKFGYQTKDCHTANVLFDCFKPKFVDLGSFVKLNNGDFGWFAREDFLRLYYYPLKLWAKGSSCFAHSVFLSNRYASVGEFLSYFYPFLRWFKTEWLIKMITSFFRYCLIGMVDDIKLKTKLSKFGFGTLLVWFKRHNLLPWQKFNFNKIMRKIDEFHLQITHSKWGDYQSNYNKENFRFEEICKITKDLRVNSAVELGGNQGFFSRLLIEKAGVTKVICTDYDDKAIDALYYKFKESDFKISPAVLDFIFPDEMPLDKRTYERFNSDAVFVLAVIHHLILTQNIPLDYIFKTVSRYTSRYVFIEFMPLGLHSDNNKDFHPMVPEWYNIDWFRVNFGHFFQLIVEKKVEENRILFVGEIFK